MRARGLLLIALLIASISRMAAAGQTPSQPAPRPFPGASTATAAPTRQGETPAGSPAAQQGPAQAAPATTFTGALEPALIFPAAEFLDDVDAGSGQRYYFYGTNADYAAVVNYYKTTLKDGGREIYKMDSSHSLPAMQQFDLGKFEERTMAYPPSVVVKDYTWNGSTGYLFVAGVNEKRFRTVIQIVPAR